MPVPKLHDNTFPAERWTSYALRSGVWLSSGLMITGLIVAAVFPSSVTLFNTNLVSLFGRLLAGSIDPVTLMYTGLIVLMFTPILRVITAIIGFAIEHDRRFMAVSLTILLFLTGEILYSILIKG